MTVREAQALLCDAGIGPAAFEARQLAAFAGGDEERLRQLVRRRIDGEPLQYLLGEWEFYGLPFYVGSGVLIPRPDTETLADLAIEFLQDREADCIDLCSGSGCLAVSVEKNCKNTQVTAVEKSDRAYNFLLKNIELNKSRVKAVKGDITKDVFGRYDLIISNPPYIKTQDLETLQQEVQHEPRAALDGGEDGLYFYREIASKWVPCLKQGGMLAVEIGIGQQEDVKRLLSEAGLKNIGERKDLCGVVRVIFGTL